MSQVIIQKNTAHEVSDFLLKAGAVQFNSSSPFRWTSGWLSPIYCDNRITLSFPGIRSRIKELLTQVVQSHFPECEGIAGVATAGIPQGALLADALNLPFAYVRGKAKEHGRENLIEGSLRPGQKVVVVEDLVSTGSSSLEAAKALQESGANVQGMVAVFTYDFDLARKKFEEEDIPLYCLSSYPYLLTEALRQKYISEEEKPVLEKWRKDPGNWSP